jgi:phosphotransferase system IIB component
MITVSWDNDEKTRIRVDYNDPVRSWDEYNAAVKEAADMIRSQEQTVHVIHNPGKTQMPPGNALMHVRRAIEQQPSNTGLTIMIISNPFARRILEVMIRLMAGRYRNLVMANSLEMAYQLIDRAESPVS